MQKTALFTLPDTNIQVLAPPAELDFFDRQSVQLSNPITPLAAWNAITGRPSRLLKVAFRIRDGISALFGVQKIGGFSSAVCDGVAVGEKLDFFLVEHVAHDVLTLSERDTHLDVLTCISTQENTLTITSSVITHNTFGRVYMLPVAPAHKWIVRSNLRRIQKEYA